MEIIAEFDRRVGKKENLRFTIGEVGSPVNGAVYVSKEVELPATITLIIPAKGERKKDVPNS